MADLQALAEAVIGGNEKAVELTKAALDEGVARPSRRLKTPASM